MPDCRQQMLRGISEILSRRSRAVEEAITVAKIARKSSSAADTQ